MKKLFASFVTAFAVVGSVSQVSSAQSEGAREVTGQVTVRSSLRYIVNLPDGYEGNGESWPLILFLHGAGERGDDLEKVKVWGPPKMIAEGKSIPAIVVSPQCPSDQWWDSNALLALLDKVEQDYRVDKDRVYVTGLSMGGFGTWALGVAAPDRFAALVPVCGGSSGPARLLRRLKDMPIWAFHGADDNVVPMSGTVDAVEAVRDAGGKPRVTIYENEGHGSWRPAYADEEMWAWMFEQRRGGGEE
ncbi:MAG: phospholipase [Phycisphaerae bacterium]|nr:phospholipase [Phycisphaerae bacterium]